MGKYDFTSLPNRLGHHTYKWKEAETDSEVLPAWIADMDFVVLPEIRQAVQTYADQLVYGYTCLLYTSGIFRPQQDSKCQSKFLDSLYQPGDCCYSARAPRWDVASL